MIDLHEVYVRHSINNKWCIFFFTRISNFSFVCFVIALSRNNLKVVFIKSFGQFASSITSRLFHLQLTFIYNIITNKYLLICLFAGTRIIYERAFLMNLKNSPLSRTPPTNVPSTLVRGCKNVPMSKLNGNRYATSISRSPPKHKPSDEQLFDMDL